MPENSSDTCHSVHTLRPALHHLSDKCGHASSPDLHQHLHPDPREKSEKEQENVRHYNFVDGSVLHLQHSIPDGDDNRHGDRA